MEELKTKMMASVEKVSGPFDLGAVALMAEVWMGLERLPSRQVALGVGGAWAALDGPLMRTLVFICTGGEAAQC